MSVPKGTTVMYVVQFRGIQVGLDDARFGDGVAGRISPRRDEAAKKK